MTPAPVSVIVEIPRAAAIPSDYARLDGFCGVADGHMQATERCARKERSGWIAALIADTLEGGSDIG